MPPRRNKVSQAKISSEVIETKINNFVSKSTEDNSSDDSGDEVNIYVESMRKSSGKIPIVPIVPPTELVVLRPVTSGEPIKKLRVRPSRAKPKPNVENMLSHPPTPPANVVEAVDYFKLLEQYKVELNKTKKELDDVKNRPPTPSTEQVPEKKSDLDIRREMFKLRFQ